MENIGQNIFSFFVGELVSFVLAYFIVDEKKRIWILIAGTVISGVFAFGDKLSIPEIAMLAPTTRPSPTPVIPPVATSKTSLDLSNYVDVYLIPVDFELKLSGTDTTIITNWTIIISCQINCTNGDYSIYRSSTDLDFNDSGWEFIDIVTNSFGATPGYWYKVELNDLPIGKYGGSARIYCCSKDH